MLKKLVSVFILTLLLTACFKNTTPPPPAEPDLTPEEIEKEARLLLEEIRAENMKKEKEENSLEEKEEEEKVILPQEIENENKPEGKYIYYKEGVIGNGEKSLLFFQAGWCSKCQEKEEFLKNLYENEQIEISTYKIDYDESEDLKKQFKIIQQDAFVLIDGDGEVISGPVFFPTEETLKQMLEG